MTSQCKSFFRRLIKEERGSLGLAELTAGALIAGMGCFGMVALTERTNPANAINMTQRAETRRLRSEEIDSRVPRFLEQEEAKRKMQRKEGLKALFYPLSLIALVPAMTAGAYFLYSPLYDSTLAEDAGAVIEEWSIMNPTKEISATNGYTSYPSYLQTIGISEDSDPYESRKIMGRVIGNPEDIMVKIIKGGNSDPAGFTVCAYHRDSDENDLTTFNSSTGENVDEEIVTCS